MSSRVRGRRVLISTIAPGSGGVSAMTEFIASTLSAHGLEPVIAHYEPYSSTARLSVPIFRLLQRSVGMEIRAAFGHYECYAMGAWLPELEFTHYWATSHWRRLMDSCDGHIVASGNVLAATPYWQTRRPYLAWLATDWNGDRRDRVKSFPWPRRVLDVAVNGPVIIRLQERLLRSGRIFAISDFTARTLSEIAGGDIGVEVMPVPVNSHLFFPRPELTVPGRIGFFGRIDDPRKNIRLFLESVATLQRSGFEVSAVLVGGRSTEAIDRMVVDLGLKGIIEIIPRVAREDLTSYLQALDVFLLPSHQEGLCIAALEAMACGVPVVSTRCGGPEEFVIDGETGFLVESDPIVAAEAIRKVVEDRALRFRLGSGARRIVEQRYGPASVERTLMSAIATEYPALCQ